MSGPTLILVRHGVTDWNEQGRLMGRNETPLNERGVVQARQAADALAGLPVRAVFASPRRRCQQTAAPIASLLELSVETKGDIDEVWLSAEWQGSTVAELDGDPDLDRVIEDPTFTSDRLESMASVEQRVVSFVETLRQEWRGETLALVSHGDPLRLILAHYLDIERRWFRRLTVDNGSVSVLKFGKRGARLLAKNWKPDLGSVVL